jgi:hypothetical protein
VVVLPAFGLGTTLHDVPSKCSMRVLLLSITPARAACDD